MKRIFFMAAIFMAVSCQTDKIAFVDNVKLMEDYKEKVDVENKFTAKAEKLNKKKDSLAQAFQLEYQTIQTKSQSMSQKKTQEELGLLQQKSQFLGQQIQQEEQQIQMEGQTEMDSVISKVKREIKNYGKANGYTYILSGGDGGSVLYGTEAKDITSEILKILNDNYKE